MSDSLACQFISDLKNKLSCFFGTLWILSFGDEISGNENASIP